MHGAFDDASIRLARALRRSPEVVEAALQDVGVDAPYLGRALLEGDPQGAVLAVSERLGVARRDLVLAVFAMQGLPREAVPRSALEGSPAAAPAGASSQTAAMGARLPRLLSRASAALLVAGILLGAFAGVALWRPELFRELLYHAAAALVFTAALACVYASWRLRVAAGRLRKAAESARKRQ